HHKTTTQQDRQKARPSGNQTSCSAATSRGPSFRAPTCWSTADGPTNSTADCRAAATKHNTTTTGSVTDGRGWATIDEHVGGSIDHGALPARRVTFTRRRHSANRYVSAALGDHTGSLVRRALGGCTWHQARHNKPHHHPDQHRAHTKPLSRQTPTPANPLKRDLSH